MYRKKGFTLIELLVVIAIIALLLSILMPALNKVKEQVKRTICTSNARQTGIALITYTSANNGRLIPYCDTGSGDELTPAVAATVLPWRIVVTHSPNATDSGGKLIPMHLGVLHAQGYIEEPKAFYCPSQRKNSDYYIPYNYGFYEIGGVWGEECPEIPSGGHIFIRTSYNYWNHGKTKIDKLKGNNAVIIDNLQEWEVIPHRKNADTPIGVTAWFADGHVNFCKGSTDEGGIFESPPWPANRGIPGDWANGPANDRGMFEEIVKRIERKY